jgi:hypothetical protein
LGSDIMENFQKLARFLALPVLASLGFIGCSSEEGTGGNGGGSGAGGGSLAPTGGTSSGAQSVAGTGSPGGAGNSAGQTSTSGSTSGGAGMSGGGQASSGSGAGGSSGAAAGSGGSAGSGGGAPAAGCNGFTGKFCDDFEGQMPGKAPSGAFKVSGPVTVDGSKAYSGSKSIKITKPSPTGQLQFSQQFPMTDLHGRAMFFVSQVPTSGGPHWDLVVAVADNGTNWEIGGMYGKYLFIVDPPDTGVDSIDFPTGKWFCLQWEYKHVPGNPYFLAKMDGTTLPNGEFTGKDPDGHTWSSGPWQNLAIGFTSYGSNVDTEVWVDDLAFGDAPIACAPPK